MKRVLLILGFSIIIASTPAYAAKEKNIIKFGRDITINRDRTVRGAAAVVGDIVINGHVEDDVVAVGGSIAIGPYASVGGNVVSVGGTIEKNPKAQIEGNIVEVNVPGMSSIAESISKYKTKKYHLIFKAVSYIGFLALAYFTIAIIPTPVKVIANIVEHKTISAITWSIRALLAIVPLAVILTMSLAGIFLIPLEVILVVAAAILGYIASAKVIGKLIIKLVTKRTDFKELNLALGITALAIFGLIPVFGWILKALVALIGFGAVIASLFPAKKVNNPAQISQKHFIEE